MRSPALCGFARGRAASLLILAACAAAVGLFPLATGYGALLLLGIAFVLIACGNTLFGLLLHPASRLLGEMAYSLYLLHGLLLFGLFHFGPGAPPSTLAHWACVLALTPCLVLLGHASFRFIEAPAMRATPALTAALRRRLQRSRDRQAA